MKSPCRPTAICRSNSSIAENDYPNVQEPVATTIFLGAHPHLTSPDAGHSGPATIFITSVPIIGLWIGGGVNYNGKSLGDTRNPYLFLPPTACGYSAIGVRLEMRKTGLSAVLNWNTMANNGIFSGELNITGYARRCASLTRKILAIGTPPRYVRARACAGSFFF